MIYKVSCVNFPYLDANLCSFASRLFYITLNVPQRNKIYFASSKDFDKFEDKLDKFEAITRSVTQQQLFIRSTDSNLFAGTSVTE